MFAVVMDLFTKFSRGNEKHYIVRFERDGHEGSYSVFAKSFDEAKEITRCVYAPISRNFNILGGYENE